MRIVQPGRSLSADWVALQQHHAPGRRDRPRGDRGRGPEARGRRDPLPARRPARHPARRPARREGHAASSRRARRSGSSATSSTSSRRAASRPAAVPRAGASRGVIRSEEAELEIGGYGTARNTVVDVLGVPVFWLPWMRYPLLTDRATGLLFPVLNSSSRTGFDIGLPFFWAALAEPERDVHPALAHEARLQARARARVRVRREVVRRVLRERHPGRRRGRPGRPRHALQRRPLRARPGSTTSTWPRTSAGRSTAVLFSDNLYPFDFRELRSVPQRPLRRVAHLRGDALRHARPLRLLRPARATRTTSRTPTTSTAIASCSSAPASWRFPACRSRSWTTLPFDVSFDTQLRELLPARERRLVLRPAPPSATTLRRRRHRRHPERRASRTSIPWIPPATRTRTERRPTPGSSEGDGVFEEGEPLVDRGQRLIVNPARRRSRSGSATWPSCKTEFGYHGTLLRDAREVLREPSPRDGAGRRAHAAPPRARAAVRRRARHAPARAAPVLDEHHRHRRRTTTRSSCRARPCSRSACASSSSATCCAIPPTASTRRTRSRSRVGNRLFVPTPPGEEGVLEPPRLFADVTALGRLGLRRRRPPQRLPRRRAVPVAAFPHALQHGLGPRGVRHLRGALRVRLRGRGGQRRRRRLPQGGGRPAVLRELLDRRRPLRRVRGGLRRDQPDRVLRSLRVHAALGRELPDPVLVRGLVHAHATRWGSSTSSRCKCWAVRLEFEQDRQAGYRGRPSATASSGSATTRCAPSPPAAAARTTR